MKGVFTISLDFELHWGGFEKWPLASYEQYFKNTREVIPRMLELFAAHQVHVTWATVGMLFHNSRQELIDNFPAHKPSYKNPQLSAYDYIQRQGIGENERSDPYHFAPSLISRIVQTPHQELATHTFAHYYCQEEGQTVEQFREDLKAAQRAAAGFGKSLTSLVFPRNQFNDQYLKICYEEGITSVRSNPLDWFWNIQSTQNESPWKRLNRGMDAYFPLGKKNTYSAEEIKAKPGYPVCIPASRLLRPYRPQESILNTFKIQRIISEMKRAAQRNEIYHLWWHPHNFGHYPEQNMQALRTILQHYTRCHEQWGMEALSMAELSDRITG